MSGPAPPTEKRPHLFLLRLSGELSIKAKGTRRRFTDRLLRNVRDALASSGISAEVRRTWSRLFVTADSPRAGEVLERIFGLASVSPIEHRTWESLDDVVGHGEAIMTPRVMGKKFAVQARRGERHRIPFRSADVERQLGAALLPHSAGVDLSQPELAVQVEVHQEHVYYSSAVRPAPAGLPTGVGGRALALVSGGFDSIVAAWLMLRRGITLDYLFCNLGGAPHRDSALSALMVLATNWSYGYRPRLHMVDIRPLVEELEARCPKPLWQVVLKRQMLRAAENLVRRSRLPAIVTGESVGQVSSQTLQNLAVISQVTPIPILRPLAGSNKEEIFEYARRIGSYDLSAKVPEYCALTGQNPATHASPQQVTAAEADLDLEFLARQVDERAVIDLRALDLEKIAAARSGEIAEIPKSATVIDLRAPVAFRSWHYPGALHLAYFEALKSFAELDRAKSYVFYCEVALKSAHLAEVMREAGFDAHYFGGGLRELRRYWESRQEVDEDLLRAVTSPVLLD